MRPPLVPPDPAAASLVGPRLTRRRLLGAFGVGGLFVAGGAWLYHALWKLGPPAPGLVCLDRDELAVSDAIAEAFFPGPPRSPLTASEVSLSAFADRYLGGLYEDNIRLFKLLFRAVNLSPVLTHGRSFCRLAPAERARVLEGWAQSELSTRRAGYASLRFVYSLGYFESPRVREALGLSHGCHLSGRADPADEASRPAGG